MIPIAKPYLTKKEAKAAYDTILTGWITQGPRVAEFEQKFAEYTGAKYAVAVSNCTTALHLSMIVAGVGQDRDLSMRRHEEREHLVCLVPRIGVVGHIGRAGVCERRTARGQTAEQPGGIETQQVVIALAPEGVDMPVQRLPARGRGARKGREFATGLGRRRESGPRGRRCRRDAGDHREGRGNDDERGLHDESFQIGVALSVDGRGKGAPTRW